MAIDNISGHSNFKGVDIAKLCEEFGELDLRKRESALGNLADFTQQAIARYNSVESDTEDGKMDLLHLTHIWIIGFPYQTNWNSHSEFYDYQFFFFN